VIILDTNVVSAMMIEPPDAAVIKLLDERAPDSIWTTTVTLFELRFGIEYLPQSRQRSRLERALDRALEHTFQGRMLPFDEAAAHESATLSADRRRRGRPVEVRDTMIAGIVISRRAEFATGNVRHFADLGVAVIDPWAT